MHKQQGWLQAWEYCQAKLIQTHQNGYQATSEPETTSEASYLGCGEKELDCCSVVQSPLFRWKYILHFIWKSRSGGTESMLLEVQCEVSTVSDDLGCHVICWCLTTVFSEVHSQRSHLPGHFRALHASFCWQALWRCWFHFPAGLGTCPHCQKVPKAGSMTMVLLCLIGQQTRLTWTP